MIEMNATIIPTEKKNSIQWWADEIMIDHREWEEERRQREGDRRKKDEQKSIPTSVQLKT